MNKLFTSLLLLAGIFLFSQERLVVEYEQTKTIDLEGVKTTGLSSVKNPGLDKAIIDAMNEPSYYKLELTSNESVYKMTEKINNEQPSDGGISVKLVSAGGVGETYKNLKENILLREIDVFNKHILIEDKLKSYDWKITRESKELLGYEVRKATAVKDSTEFIVAWYAPKLAFSNGPENYQGLPGLILEMETSDKDGKNKTITKAVALNVEKDGKAFKRPTKGKKMSSEEYLEFTQEQSEKMKSMYGGGVDTD